MMGQVADWILDGGGCEWCGVAIGDGSGTGYRQLCAGCAREAREQGYEVENGVITSRPEGDGE